MLEFDVRIQSAICKNASIYAPVSQSKAGKINCSQHPKPGRLKNDFVTPHVRFQISQYFSLLLSHRTQHSRPNPLSICFDNQDFLKLPPTRIASRTRFCSPARRGSSIFPNVDWLTPVDVLPYRQHRPIIGRRNSNTGRHLCSAKWMLFCRMLLA